VSALPRPILFIGPIHGAIARNLQPLSHVGIFPPGEVSGVANWIIAQSEAFSPITITTTLDPAAHRTSALAALVAVICDHR
jgi:colanic acid biosynthesis glycosyl transferase WcaI